MIVFLRDGDTALDELEERSASFFAQLLIRCAIFDFVEKLDCGYIKNFSETEYRGEICLTPLTEQFSESRDEARRQILRSDPQLPQLFQTDADFFFGVFFACQRSGLAFAPSR
jgi:hypothetical protein